MTKVKTYYINQTLKRNGDVTRLCVDFSLASEAQVACHDLNIAFPKSRHEVKESIQNINTIKTIIEELT